MKNKVKVTFANDTIVIEHGRNHLEIAGRLNCGGGMVYVTMVDPSDNSQRVIARFKYKSPKANAKDWVKFILQHYTPGQLVEILWKRTHTFSDQTTPLGLAEKHGYVSLNRRKYEKEKAQWREDMKTYLFNYEARPCRFNETSCSQCGRVFGPGNHGFSRCANHAYL